MLCSRPIDDLTYGRPLDEVKESFRLAAEEKSVAIMHGHAPHVTISLDWLEQVLELADTYGLELVTFSDLDPDEPPRAALALAFDDDSVDAWYDLRGLLAAHGARVTFFVTYYTAWTDEQRAKLAALAAAGHDVQSHSVAHLNAPDYVRDHGLEAYLADEVLPSIKVLEDEGYPMTAFTFPFGASTDELDEALLKYFRYVRVGPRSCPW